MAPVVTKTKAYALGIGFALVGLIGFLIHQLAKARKKVENSENNEDESQESENGEEKFSKLMSILDSNDEGSILIALNKLGNLTAFKEFQILVRKYDGLVKIPAFIRSSSQDVKVQALNVINNLAMDIENQSILKDFIPDLVTLLRHDQRSSGVVILAATRALTNLTTVDENHRFLLPHLLVLLELLRISEFSIKLQVLKILVNISTNTEIVETQLELDIQIIRAVSELVGITIDEEILLRTVACLANILSALQARWQNKNKSLITTAEFVPDDMERRLGDLQHHKNEDIVRHAGRALTALQPSAIDGTRPSSVDMIEVLQL